MVSFTPRPLYTLGNSCQYRLDRRRDGPYRHSGAYGEVTTPDPTRTRIRTPTKIASHFTDCATFKSTFQLEGRRHICLFGQNLTISSYLRYYEDCRLMRCYTAWNLRRFLKEPHGVTSQKTPFFIVTAVKISNLT
jgi:hypothetical protein